MRERLVRGTWDLVDSESVPRHVAEAEAAVIRAVRAKNRNPFPYPNPLVGSSIQTLPTVHPWDTPADHLADEVATCWKNWD